ncbi:hypothetical protein QCA50_007384 [Cerrena zonata]|uniref:Uncharacterized protein n=1 Tax=Cerrena zonata TaxID=2478898 RepID=A0AAW0GI62_9APHY
MDQTNSTNYGPSNESSTDIFWEKTWMAATYLTGVGFGLQLIVYCISFQALWNRKMQTPFIFFLLGFITVLAALNCAFTGVNAFGLQQAYIDMRNYPGGPWVYLQDSSSGWINIVSEVTFYMSNIMCDAMLLWRCRIVWLACIGHKSIYYMIIPFLMLLASIALAILSIDVLANPTAGFFSVIEGNINLSSYTLSLGLNVILTVMIVGRMWLTLARGRKLFGKAYGEDYRLTMFVESAGLYSMNCIGLLISYGLNHPISQIFLSLNPATQVIANYLIIIRVAQGRAWTSTTASKIIQTGTWRTGSDTEAGSGSLKFRVEPPRSGFTASNEAIHASAIWIKTESQQG